MARVAMAHARDSPDKIREPCFQPCKLLPGLEIYRSSWVLRRNPGVTAATARGAHACSPGSGSSICKTYLIIAHVLSLHRSLRLDLDGPLMKRRLSPRPNALSPGEVLRGLKPVLARGRNVLSHGDVRGGEYFLKYCPSGPHCMA